MSFLSFCGPDAGCGVTTGKRFDDVDRAQEQLREVLRVVEAKLDALSEVVRTRLPLPAKIQPPDEAARDITDGAGTASAADLREVCKGASQELLGGVPQKLKVSSFVGSATGSSSSITRWRNRSHHNLGGCDTLSENPQAKVWYAWNPDSLSRTVFEGTSMVVLLYDAFLMPYRLAWDVPDERVSVYIAVWITRIFWTIDLILNLVTGYRNKHGVLELRLVLAFRRYLATWFCPDLILVMCDWLAVFSGHRWMHGMRVIRLIRGGRQIFRVWTLLQKAKMMIQSKGFHLAIDISLIFVVVLWVNHVVCCGWYSIGRYGVSDTGTTWLDVLEDKLTWEHPAAAEYYNYLTALHWAITQMTPGSMEVVPENSTERIYSVCTLFLGLLLGSSLIATLTSAMTQYKLRIEASSRKFMELHQFLNQQGVDPQLALAIKHQVRVRSQETKRLKTEEVEYLSLVSNNLREALWHSWCMRHLAQHPFFNALNHLDHLAMQFLCNSSIKSEEFPVSDAVFEEGAQGECMYFLAHGQLRYNPGELAPEANLQEQDVKLVLKQGDWCSEPALWTLWTHLGTLEAVATSEVLCVSGEALQRTLQRYPDVGAILVDYCRTFHKYINEPGVLKSDLRHCSDINELISGLKPSIRIQLANPVVQSLELRFWGQFINQRNLEALKDEVANGKCDIGFIGQEPVRNTFVVALHIRKSAEEADRFLVKVGEVLHDNNRVMPYCLLPGVKRRWQETYLTAVERLLANDLGRISHMVEPHLYEGFEQTVIIEPSPSLGIRTRYLRTTFPAVLREGANLPNMPAYATVPELPGHQSCMAFFRRDARLEADVKRDAAAILSGHKNLVVLQCDEGNRASKKLYIWLNAKEFKALSHKTAKPVIQQWVAAVVDQTRHLRPRAFQNVLASRAEVPDETDDPNAV